MALSAPARYLLGADVGGTFTDITLLDQQTRQQWLFKLPSTPHHPAEAILHGVAQILQTNGVAAAQVDYLVHGTTVATNALIQRKGARLALITTRGMRDLTEIGRQTRPSLYNLQQGKPQPLVPAYLRFEVDERITADGEIDTPLDLDQLRQVCGQARAQGVTAVAVCFLFSYLNPIHERQALEVIAQEWADQPQFFSSASHQVVPEFREYPRFSTTVLNAFLGPTVASYMETFERQVGQLGLPRRPYIMQSNGGVISVPEACQRPIKTALSGPSAGVMAAVKLAQQLGQPNLITFDMGGTSADLSLVVEGQPQMAAERLLEGFPARTPMVDIVAIGAGGGSLAYLDPGGALKVGPQSAGAVPGPACYLRGGTVPTVTDAHLALGRLGPQSLLDGQMTMSLQAAQQAIDTHLAQPTGLSRVEAAQGILAVVNAHMARAIRLVTVERGHDPRQFALVAFGGAGPLHAAELAQEMGIPRVVVPAAPGLMCAQGLLESDLRTDLVRSRRLLAEEGNQAQVAQFIAEMMAEGQLLLEREGIAPQARAFEARVEARYRGQNYEISVPVELGRPLSLSELVQGFHQAHQHKYGYHNPQQAIELVNCRLTAWGRRPAPVEVGLLSERPQGLPAGWRSIQFAADPQPTPIYRRETLFPGAPLAGPLVVEQLDATTVVPPGWFLEVDALGNLHLFREVGDGRN